MTEKDEHDFALAIGRSVVQSARLEHELTHHTAGLLNASDWLQGYQEIKGQNVTVVLDKFKELIESRTPAGPNSLRDKLSGIASDARHLFDRRNELVHSVWVPRVEPSGSTYEVHEWEGKRYAPKRAKCLFKPAAFAPTEVAELHSKFENLREELTLAMHYAFTNCSWLFERRP